MQTDLNLTKLPDDFKLSVAIPIFNEESVLPELHRRLSVVLDQVPGGEHEIVFVDDGSTDGSREILAALAVMDPRVKVVLLSRNFGHQAALSAALDHVTGHALVMMDGDLQDTPETIPKFLKQLNRGYDVVYAIREKRKEAWWLRACYGAFYWTIQKLSQFELPVGSGDFGLVSRRVLDQMRKMPERHRYLRGLRSWVGFQQVGIRVERDARHSGESKYSLSKLFMLAFDGIFSFSVKPLRVATLLGAVTIVGSLGFALFAIMAHLFWNRSPEGFTALLTCISLLAGIQMLFLGVVGEYVGRIYEQVKLRPLYLVDRVLTCETVMLEDLDGPSEAYIGEYGVESNTLEGDQELDDMLDENLAILSFSSFQQSESSPQTQES